MLDELHATASSLVALQTDRARVGNLVIDSIITEGDPAEKILESAAARHVGLIVVGTHGRRGLRRLFVGSVAENVVRRSSVPVIVIRASSRHVKTERESALATGAICYT
jgi:nucleotide-binding universal stress UspA family protein